jgi:hypothetical protein
MSNRRPDNVRKIGTLNEKPLHAALKAWYARPRDLAEVSVDGFVVDIARDDLLVEIQTQNFSAIKRKMFSLTSRHPVRLVYPIPLEKWIVKLDDDETRQLSRRKSPKRGSAVHLFDELVSFPQLMTDPNFSLHVLFIHEEEARTRTRKRRWRRRAWTKYERRLLRVVDQRLFCTPSDLAELVPPALREPFTTRDLATAMSKPRRLAQRMAYCLREMKVLAVAGKRGNAFLYSRMKA